MLIPENIDTRITVYQFLTAQFPHIAAEDWQQRILQHKVHWKDGTCIDLSTRCQPKQRVYYYREVQQETKVPFDEQILFENDRFMIVFKPHFLPVTPSGNYVNECLVHRLRIRMGIDTITPAHRLDKDTAGIMLFTKTPEYRGTYHNLFMNNLIHKQYHAIAKLTPEVKSRANLSTPQHWDVKSRIVRSSPSFLMQNVEGEINAHSKIQLIKIEGDRGLFELEPITGKTHQLRVHMQKLGMPIVNDRFYPTLQPESKPDFNAPLKLLAIRLKFIDPIDFQAHDFSCDEIKIL